MVVSTTESGGSAESLINHPNVLNDVQKVQTAALDGSTHLTARYLRPQRGPWRGPDFTMTGWLMTLVIHGGFVVTGVFVLRWSGPLFRPDPGGPSIISTASARTERREYGSFRAFVRDGHEAHVSARSYRTGPDGCERAGFSGTIAPNLIDRGPVQTSPCTGRRAAHDTGDDGIARCSASSWDIRFMLSRSSPRVRDLDSSGPGMMPAGSRSA